MDYRSAGLIMLSALIMWVQHRHNGFALAQLASGAVEVGHQAEHERLTSSGIVPAS